jgi:hypothetical protein
MSELRSHDANRGTRPVEVARYWLAVVGLFSLTITSSSAETEVLRDSEGVYLRADNARLSEVFAAISTHFDLIYPSDLAVERLVTGTYSGSLRYVLSRILDGSNYVLKFSGEQVEVKVFGTSNPVDRQAASSAVAVAQNIPAFNKIAKPVRPALSHVAPLVPR